MLTWLFYSLFEGDEANVTNFNIKQILPRTFEYLTYEGSLTIPGCYETVTWIILNKPLRISAYQVSIMIFTHTHTLKRVFDGTADVPIVLFCLYFNFFGRPLICFVHVPEPRTYAEPWTVMNSFV